MVVSVFKGLRYLLYPVFDESLSLYTKPLDEAIQALHEKILDVVPEYQEFLNNNK